MADNLKAGPELDRLVAEKVMGLKRLRLDEAKTRPMRHDEFVIYPESGDSVNLPAFSTDIAAAWVVFEKLKGMSISMRDDGVWDCRIIEPGTHGIRLLESMVLTNGETAPHAICLAALKAVGAGIP